MLKDGAPQIGYASKVVKAESSDPEYLAWKRREIEAALKEADEHPEDFMTQEEVWRKFGLEG